MNVLVTGGAGFLGAYTMAALEAAGHTAFAYDVAPPTADLLSVAPALAARFRSGQIGDLARLFDVCRIEKVDAMVHAAGLVGLEPSLAQPLATYQTNIMGLVHACEAARQLAMRKLIAISSNAAYHKGGDKLVETDPPFSVTDGNPESGPMARFSGPDDVPKAVCSRQPARPAGHQTTNAVTIDSAPAVTDCAMRTPLPRSSFATWLTSPSIRSRSSPTGVPSSVGRS